MSARGDDARPVVRILPDYCREEPQLCHSDQVLEEGDIMSLDSGGNYPGYMGDLCRMGILGEPDAELCEQPHATLLWERILDDGMSPLETAPHQSGDDRPLSAHQHPVGAHADVGQCCSHPAQDQNLGSECTAKLKNEQHF
jgi:hypothetical protein